MNTMRHGSLFSGIGGFDLAASRMGWDNVFQVEIYAYCRRVLKKNFPDAKQFEDIREFDGSEFAGKIDIISGGFPCQPFSIAGRRRGKADDRALWGEMLRVIRTIRPAWVVGENVAGIVSMELDTVLSDLESIGYACQAFVIPACAVGALHRRDRVWIIAYADSEWQLQSKRLVTEIGRRAEYGFKETAFDTNCNRRTELLCQQRTQEQRPDCGRLVEDGSANWLENPSDLLRAAYGLPGRVDKRIARIKALGNAIVPQVAFNIFHQISLFHEKV